MNAALKEQWDELRKGNKEALFSLYNSMYFHLVRYGLLQRAEEELVKDCINQLFLKLWEKQNTLSEVHDVKSYLLTAFRRLIQDELAYQQKMDVALLYLADSGPQNELSYEELLINSQQSDLLKKKLHQAIDQLTPKQKEHIKLKFFEGLTYEQIAQQNTLSVKTAYNTIYDAIKTLRKLLK
ncbi:RNA polymerase, sigma subunit, SigV [bacterium A37T11]|nr:RNA polymerase, sigma subunit, SigV [bacterium A37T11]